MFALEMSLLGTNFSQDDLNRFDYITLTQTQVYIRSVNGSATTL